MSDSSDVIEITTVSQKKVEANRRNAQLSTGPRTAEGKRWSSGNAIKHGFYASAFFGTHGAARKNTQDFHDLLLRLRERSTSLDELRDLLAPGDSDLLLQAEACFVL